jgi:hypothetical protein
MIASPLRHWFTSLQSASSHTYQLSLWCSWMWLRSPRHNWLYRTWNFITAIVAVRRWTLSHPDFITSYSCEIQFSIVAPRIVVGWKTSLKLSKMHGKKQRVHSTSLCQCLPSCIFPSGVPTKIRLSHWVDCNKCSCINTGSAAASTQVVVLMFIESYILSPAVAMRESV